MMRRDSSDDGLGESQRSVALAICPSKFSPHTYFVVESFTRQRQLTLYHSVHHAHMRFVFCWLTGALLTLLRRRRIMRTTQCVLAIAATLFAAVEAADLTLVPFYEAMSQGDRVILAEHGPFTFSSSCDSSAVSGQNIWLPTACQSRLYLA